MAEYISRESVLQILSDKNAAWDAYQKVQSLPAAEVVPIDFHERCLQIEIQKRMALEKADAREVVLCKDCRHRDPEDHKCDCGGTERQGCPFKVADDYFCAYGER